MILRDRSPRDEMLDVADTLSNLSGSGSAFVRRAASTAYYVAFHALAELCADTLLPGVPPDSFVYLRVYRALDHGPLKTIFAQAPLKDRPAIGQIGIVVVKLQSARIAADYLPLTSNPISTSQATDLVREARQLVDDLDALSPDDRRLLAVCLLFRTRDASARP